MEKTGLVIEGGGIRGIYASGVLDVLMEHGVVFDGVIGVSAGAVHGCEMVSGQPGRSIRYSKKYCTDDRFMSVRSLLRTGDIVGADFCYRELPEELDPFDYEAYDQSPTRFYVTCSNLETGKAEYLEITDMRKQIDLIRASASLPYVSRIVTFDGMKLLDGGCTDSIPVKAFQRMGYTKDVVILTRDADYVKKPQNVLPARCLYRKYPRFVEALKRRHTVYNQTRREIVQMEQQGEVFVIRPSEALKIGRMSHDAEAIQKIYDIGRKDAAASLEALLAWMGTGRGE